MNLRMIPGLSRDRNSMTIMHSRQAIARIDNGRRSTYEVDE